MDYRNDISESLALAAHSGTSFVPETRAMQERDGYAATLAQDYENMRAQAEKGHALDLLEAEFERYREGYRKRYRAHLASRSRCISTMITGASNFPSRRNEKRNNIAHKRLTDLTEYRERALASLRRTLRPDIAPIRTEDSDASQRLAEKLTKLEAIQARMKSANLAIRKHKKTGEASQVAALVAEGFSEARARDLLKPDFCGRIGFADYELTNNGAEIRRCKARMVTVERAQTAEAVEIDGANGVRFEDCPADNRVRLFFPGKPEESVRSNLKSFGFRWSPTIGCWQAFRNAWAIQQARAFAGLLGEAPGQ